LIEEKDMVKEKAQSPAGSKAGDPPTDISRRRLMIHSAALGVAAAGLGLGIGPATSFAASGEPIRVGASGIRPLEVDSPMARWKKPQNLEFVTGATKRFSFPNWQSGNDDSVFELSFAVGGATGFSIAMTRSWCLRASEK